MDSLTLPRCLVRPYRVGDEDVLARHANDPDVSRYMRDRFPYPYTHADAEGWVGLCLGAKRLENWAIEIDGAFAGGIGVVPGVDVHRLGGELGYWLGRVFWNRGVMTEIVRAFTPWVMDRFGFVRLEAQVYAGNTGSMRVLEKAGYVHEGVRRKAIVKRGEVLDLHVYAHVR